jgi:PAP2 superfamily
MWLPWQPALVAAMVFAAFAVATRPSISSRVAVARGFAGELALVLGLYSLWQIAGQLSVMRVDGAIDRGRSIWHIEQALHLPSELSLQRALLSHPLAIQFANVYYATAHVTAVILVLIWAYIWHRDRYPQLRNVLALLTGACLLIQLVPVAPPRLVPGLGFVDAAHLYGQSVYTAVGTGVSDQLSAMPSLHVGWAILVAVAVVLIGTSPWRWLIVLHPIATLIVVGATANHWWLDGIVAVVVLGLAVVVDRAARGLLARGVFLGRAIPSGGDKVPVAIEPAAAVADSLAEPSTESVLS